jgi:hypothetical protein
MVRTKHYDRVLALGEKLVEELDLKDRGQTLDRWMAHYIAGLIEEAAKAVGSQRQQKRARCAKAILDLWSHRPQFPDGKRPFEDFDPVLRVMKSLDPNPKKTRYLPWAVQDTKIPRNASATEPWLNAAVDIDRTAKTLIGYCISVAAVLGLQKSRSWMKLVESAMIRNAPDIEAIRIVIETADSVSREQRSEPVRQADRMLKTLEAFETYTKFIRRELELIRAALQQQT